MFRNTLAIIIAVAVLTVGLTLQSAQAQSQSQSALAARATVSDLGIRSKVEVKITDGTKVKGRIGEIKDQSFTVADAKTGVSQEINYAEVTSVKKSNSGVSPLTWGILGGVAATAVIVGLTVIKPVLCDGGAGC